jgi:3-hydroxyisobutyrate dehydrogenase-like beta-hydroxyacid dehydrogenase
VAEVMNRVTRTGMIGLGAMGNPMARHMAAKGFTVSGYDVVGELNAKASRSGIKIGASPAEVGREAQVVVIMVATDQQVIDAVLEEGLLEALEPGAVICIASSVSPETCRELEAKAAKKGVGVLDTPVVLGQKACDEGTMTVFVGGEEKWFRVAEPVLKTFGRHVIHIGPSGAGQIAKTANNMLLWACMSANYEVLTLARKLGANIPQLIEALQHSSGANWSLAKWGESTGKWAEKDLDVAIDLAQAAKVPLPLTALVDQLMKGMNQEKMKALLS